MVSVAPFNLKGDPRALPNPTKGLLCWIHTPPPHPCLICVYYWYPWRLAKQVGLMPTGGRQEHMRSPVLWVWVLTPAQVLRTTWFPFSTTAPFPLRVTPSPTLLGSKDTAPCPSQASAMTLLPQTRLLACGGQWRSSPREFRRK